ncbi:MAG TPA: tetratricopeptide repeat protein [Povalibacter sp.]|uniref:YfgM family protein n=1 Tax=Povalibacter sp. TaxID=1962978 RepID=UPI002C89299A|nr:tetratricopeptide repeat protein [Povalibacter sp.]HMN43196.1 tetratricopeptide repeat protein [Povalibacter sp.]
MVDELLSDNEREEALREWWRDNWAWILGGIVLGIALLVGWNYWGTYQVKQAEAAAHLYGDVEAALLSGDSAKAEEALKTLTSQFDSSPYAAQARLAVAKLHTDAGRYTDAEALLRQVASGSKDKELADLAKLRVARLLIQQGKHDEAVKLLEPLTAGGFGAEAREIRGDALFAKGDREGARAEYAAALADTDAAIDRSMVELKLQDVGGVVPAAAAQGTP